MTCQQVLLIVLATCASRALAGVSVGGQCSTDNDGLDANTGRFSSDCDETSYCSGAMNGTCQTRRCRRDEFPFGFQNTTPTPPLCADGTYCPDEGSGCKPLASVGQACQVDRDEQCAPSPDADTLAGEWNHGGAVCLQGTCVYANMTLGQPCTVDVVTYMEGPYKNTITRHNCQTPLFFCHTDMHACIPTKAFGSPCNADQECRSYNCGTRGVCMDPAGTPVRVKTWQVALTGISVIAAMAAIVIMLTLFHKRHRLQRSREIREYYEEQMGLRRSLAALHAAAADRYAKDKLYDQ
ncbi:hypothetical protein C8Q80DRAFT_1222434 [Daedaleopsis nitida]|nr:hypothetical protein C8Q80DRAFT_1222434 [Daedaleopsis nitida]